MGIFHVVTFLIHAITLAIASVLVAVFTRLVPALVALVVLGIVVFAVCTTCGVGGGIALARRRSRRKRSR